VNCPVFTAAASVEPQIAGVVAGDDKLRESLVALADATDGAVRLLGHRDDVADLLAAADIVCLTSDAEALPMSVLEAMAAGRAVVATRVGDLSEAVVDGETGILVEPGDVSAFARALEEFAADPARAAAMGVAARVRQQRRFTHDAMLEASEVLLVSCGRGTVVGARRESAVRLRGDRE
jgi:glycosyltransferase involved in cell wall biosynthesis